MSEIYNYFYNYTQKWHAEILIISTITLRSDMSEIYNYFYNYTQKWHVRDL